MPLSILCITLAYIITVLDGQSPFMGMKGTQINTEIILIHALTHKKTNWYCRYLYLSVSVYVCVPCPSFTWHNAARCCFAVNAQRIWHACLGPDFELQMRWHYCPSCDQNTRLMTKVPLQHRDFYRKFVILTVQSSALHLQVTAQHHALPSPELCMAVQGVTSLSAWRPKLFISLFSPFFPLDKMK